MPDPASDIVPVGAPGIADAPAAAPRQHGGWRRFLTRAYWRAVFTQGTSPREVGFAFGLGAAIGVAPLPGLQMAAVGLLCWRLRLNFAIAIAASNISLGPLLVMWAAIAASLGRWLRLGVVPWQSYHSFIADFERAPAGWDGVLAVLGTCMLDWILGSLLLMPTVGGAFGLVGYAIARGIRSARAKPVETAHTGERVEP